MASAAQPMGDPYQVLKVTGEWTRRRGGYIGMCKAEITGSKEIQQDLAYMAGQWRDTVVDGKSGVNGTTNCRNNWAVTLPTPIWTTGWRN